jgi:DNA (cytosine-5)-methyltransferase 1
MAEALDDPWQRAIDGAEKIRPPRLLAAMERIEPATGWATVDSGSPRQANYSLADFLDDDADQPWWSRQEVDRHLAMMFDRHRRQVESLAAVPRQSTPVTGFRRVRQGQQRLEVRFDGIAGCLRTPRGGSAKQVVIFAGRGDVRMRWMTPREYARLQGAPDFVLPENDIQAWFGFGDAVCVPAIEWIDRAMLTLAWESTFVVSAPGSAWGLAAIGTR